MNNSSSNEFYLFQNFLGLEKFEEFSIRLSDLSKSEKEYNRIAFRSSRPEGFCKKDVVRNFTIFTGYLM